MSRNSSYQGIATSMHLSEELQLHGRKWYFSRQEIEDCSPSRKDGIDLAKESELRALYCEFIQKLGKKLQVPQLAIACAWMLCHRFFMRQSHAKNDWKIIATVSMFLACKIQETPCLLRDVVVVAYELMHEADPSAPQRIRRTEFCNKQKELVVTGERVLLATIAFDFDIQLPYKALVDALKKLELCPKVAKTAWYFVNDWLCTTLCLQYKPHYIAAGSLFLASKWRKVKLPKERGNVWWLTFDVSPKQLEDVIQVMHRLLALAQDKKQTLPQKHMGISQSGASAGMMIVSSPQSTITSISSSHSTCINMVGTMASGGINRKVSPCQTTDSGTTTALGDVIESQQATITSISSSHSAVPCKVSPCQTTDSATTVVGDGIEIQRRTGESLPSSRTKNPVHNLKIDSDRIRLALKRRRSQVAKEAENIERHSDDWIETEVEHGIELESAPLEKRPRKL